MTKHLTPRFTPRFSRSRSRYSTDWQHPEHERRRLIQRDVRAHSRNGHDSDWFTAKPPQSGPEDNMENGVGGKAAKHLKRRLRVNDVNTYYRRPTQIMTDSSQKNRKAPTRSYPWTPTAEEMLKHLETIFQDPNKEVNAKREFRKWNMRITEKFYEQACWPNLKRWPLQTAARRRKTTRGHDGTGCFCIQFDTAAGPWRPAAETHRGGPAQRRLRERISLLLFVASGPTLHSDNKNLRTDENIRAAELPIRIVSYTKRGKDPCYVVQGRAIPEDNMEATGNDAADGPTLPLPSAQRDAESMRRIANRYEDEFLDGECASFRRLVSALRFLAQQLLGGPRDGLALREHVHAFVVHPPLLRHGSSGSVHSMVKSMTGTAVPDSSFTAVSEEEEGIPAGKRSSSERYELTAESESVLRSVDRFDHEGKAHDALIPIAIDLRGVISSNVSLGEGGGGGGGGNEEGDGEDRVLLLKV
ncbi:hypothetical protein V8E54_011671 [Elaphomyces granulatus]